MKSQFGRWRWLCLFIASLFLMEYLEPSTIGVRTDLEVPMKHERTDARDPQSSEGHQTAPSHAMLFSGSSSLEARLMVRSFRTDPALRPPQFVFSTIYRPPLAAR